MHTDTRLDLDYFVEWRPYLYKPVVKWLVQEPERFAGKKVLDLGCRFGRMSCYFALLGARVIGIDLPRVDLTKARQEAQRCHVQDQVSFSTYTGDPFTLEEGEYDFVFTKSVLVIVPNLQVFLEGLNRSLKIGGELLAAENNQLGSILTKAMSLLGGDNTRQKNFRGVDPEFIQCVQQVFGNVEFKNFYGLVSGIRSQRIK